MTKSMTKSIKDAAAGACVVADAGATSVLLTVGDASLKLPAALCPWKAGDALAVSWLRTSPVEAGAPDEAALVLDGVVMRSSETRCVVSCGGMLCELPAPSTSEGDTLRVVVAASATPKRPRRTPARPAARAS